MAGIQSGGEGQGPGGFSQRDFRDAMGQFATGVVIVSTEIEGEAHAMTANAFMSGSLDPFLVLVSIARTARMHDRLRTAGHFGVSVLSQSQQWISNHFAGRPSPDRRPAFEPLSRTPVVAGAAVRLSADLRHEYACGDHTLYVGEVWALQVDREPGEPLLYYGGRYRQVAMPDWMAETMPQILWQENELRY